MCRLVALYPAATTNLRPNYDHGDEATPTGWGHLHTHPLPFCPSQGLKCVGQGVGEAVRAMTTVTIQLLGTFSVTRDGVPVSHFRGDKVRALLAYMATEAERPHRRAWLAALLWPDHEESAALRNLSQTLLRLRQALGDTAGESRFLDSTRATLQWRDEDTRVDVLDFLRLARSTDPGGLAGAAEIYRGEFLPGFDLPDTGAFEEWLLLMRGQLQQQALTVLHTLATQALAGGQWAKAAEVARRAIALDPWREVAHRQLMRALAEGGDRAAALAQYESCRAVLAEELGVEPDEETRILYERIHAHELTPATIGSGPSRPRLPTALTSFIGREADLQALANLLRQGNVRLLTLLGAGGMGKTRLALEVARGAVHSYSDGVALVPLAPLTNADAIPTAIAHALGVMLHGNDPAVALPHFLRDKQMLLILDNMEHLMVGVGLVVSILEEAPGVEIITTSRQHLNVRGEQVYCLEGLEYSSGARPGEMASPAARLFLQSGRRVRPGFHVQADELAVVERIGELLQGMPLALEMAAAWVGQLPLADIAAEIERSLDFLQTDWADAPERQRSMRAVFEWSWRLLSEPEQVVLRRMSVFRGGFTREAAETVTGATLRVLADLSHKSLVRWHPGHGAGRYEIHELPRQFAGQQLDAAPGEREAVEIRHGAYHLALAEKAGAQLYGPDQGEWLDRLEAAYPNIRHTLDWCLDRAEQQGAWLDEGLRLAARISPFWWRRGYLVEGGFYLDRLLALDERWHAAATGTRAGAVLEAGFLACFRGDYPLTTALARRAIALGEPLNDRRGMARAHRLLGEAALEQGDTQAAHQLFQRQLDLAREAGDLVWQGDAYNMLGEVARRLGRYDEATALLEQSVLLGRSAQHVNGTVAALSSLGQVARDAGDAGGARRWFRESLRTHASLQIKRLIAYDLEGLAASAALDGDARQALVYQGAAEVLREEIDSPLPPGEAAILDRVLAPAVVGLSERQQQQALADGRSRPLAQVIADALGEPLLFP